MNGYWMQNLFSKVSVYVFKHRFDVKSCWNIRKFETTTARFYRFNSIDLLWRLRFSSSSNITWIWIYNPRSFWMAWMARTRAWFKVANKSWILCTRKNQYLLFIYFLLVFFSLRSLVFRFSSLLFCCSCMSLCSFWFNFTSLLLQFFGRWNMHSSSVITLVFKTVIFIFGFNFGSIFCWGTESGKSTTLIIFIFGFGFVDFTCVFSWWVWIVSTDFSFSLSGFKKLREFCGFLGVESISWRSVIILYFSFGFFVCSSSGLTSVEAGSFCETSVAVSSVFGNTKILFSFDVSVEGFAGFKTTFWWISGL